MNTSPQATRDLEAYRRKLSEFVNRSGLFMQPFIEIAQEHKARIVFAEGENEGVAMRQNATALATVLVELGEADGLICGKVGVFNEHLKTVGGMFAPADPAHTSPRCARCCCRAARCFSRTHS